MSERWFWSSRRPVARSLFTWRGVSRFCGRVVWGGCWAERAEMRDGFWRIDWRSVVLGVEVRRMLLRWRAAG